MDTILRDCKKLAKKKAIKLSVILIIVIVAIVGYEGCAVYNYFTGPKDFYDVYEKIGELDSGIGFNAIRNQSIKLEVDHIYEPYATYYTTRDGVREKGSEKYYYVFQVDDDYYITVEVPASEKVAYDKLCDQTANYNSGKTDKLPTPIILTGGFSKLSDAELRKNAEDYFKEAEYDIDKDGLEYYLSPYILQSGKIDDKDPEFMWLLVIAVAVLFIVIIVTWLNYIYGKNLKQVKHYLEQLSDEDHYTIGQDYENAIKGKDIALGEKWCYYFGKMGMGIIAYRDMVWMYMYTVNHRTNGIPTGKTRSIILYDWYGGKAHTLCTGASEARINEVLHKLYEKHPNMFIGYSDENMTLFKNDFRKMADIATSTVKS